MAYNGVDLATEPSYLSDGSYTSQNDRARFDDIMYDGIIAAGDYLISAGTGFTLSSAAGIALVKGQNVTDQGLYRASDVAHANAFTITTADLTKPRVDQLILRIWDASHDTSGSRKGRLELVPGTATTGATLGNRTGAADLTTLTDNSKSVLLLADILVPAGVTTSAACTIRDRRKLARPKNVPYKNGVSIGSATSGSTSEQDLVAVQTIPAYLIRDAFHSETRYAKINIYFQMLQNSGGAATTIWKVYLGRQATFTAFWADTSPSIGNSAVSRPCQIELILRFSSGGVMLIGGSVTVGGQPATAGQGDLASGSLTSGLISEIGSLLGFVATNTTEDVQWKVTSQHSSSSGSFQETVYDVITEIT